MAKRPPVQIAFPQNEVQISSPDGPSWTLTALIKEALKKNPELYAYQERWKAAKARVWRAMSWEDTMMGADFEGIPRGRGDADRNTDIEWMISQKIPFPGKRFLKGRVAAKEARMAEADYRAKEREIINEIKKAYAEYALRGNEAMNHGETKRILERLAGSAETRYSTGQIPYHEVLRVHTELATIINDIAKHHEQIQTARARLNMLLGREALAPLLVAAEVPGQAFSYTREDLMRLALENRPELRAMRYGLEAAKTDVKAAWLDLLPDAQVKLEARQFSGEGRIREYDQFLGFEVPIFSRVGRAGQIKEKRAEKRAAEGSWENMKNMVLLEVQEAWAEFQSNDRTVKLYKASVIPQAESIVQSALAEYESGQGNFLTVMEAEKALTDFRHEYFHSLAMREESFADLERMVGIDLIGGNLK